MRSFISLVAIVLWAATLPGCSTNTGNPSASTAQNTATRPSPASTTAPQAASTTATPQSPTGPTTPSDGVRRITPAELRDALEKDKAIVVDVRTEAPFKAGHIKGARLIPAGEIASHVGKLPKDKLIVTYCA